MAIPSVLWSFVASSTSFIWWMLVATTLLAAALVAFERIAWRLPPFRWFVRRPDLRGTWGGTLSSDYADGTRREVFLVVHQTFSTLKLRLQTEESHSVSTMASVVAEPDEPISLSYMYRSEPKLEHQKQSRTHWGAVRLILQGPNGRTLAGEYWTDRRTAGALELRLVSRIEAAGWRHATELAGVGGSPAPNDGAKQQQPVPGAVPPRERVPRRLVDTLAAVANEPEAARTLAVRAGFPREHLPEFRSPLSFWTAVVEQAASGRCEERSLIAEAAKQFPHNIELQGLVAGLGANGD